MSCVYDFFCIFVGSYDKICVVEWFLHKKTNISSFN